mgnify:CR=1 FL=1
MDLRAKTDTAQGLGQQLLTFTTRKFEDPALFEIHARYVPVSGEKVIDYDFVVADQAALAELDCHINNVKFLPGREKLPVGENVSVFCRRNVERSYDIRLVPPEELDNLVTITINIPRIYRPVVTEVQDALVFSVLACEGGHCDPSRYPPTDIEKYEGRLLSLYGKSDWSTIPLPAQLRDRDLIGTRSPQLTCDQTDNFEYGAFRVEKGDWLPGGQLLKVYGDTQLKPDRPEPEKGAHAALSCTLVYAYRKI